MPGSQLEVLEDPRGELTLAQGEGLFADRFRACLVIEQVGGQSRAESPGQDTTICIVLPHGVC